MNKTHSIIFIIIVTICVAIQLHCDNEDTPFQLYEQNWKNCYDENFHFENDTTAPIGDYVECELNGDEVQVNLLTSSYKSLTYHGSYGTVSNPDVTINQDSGTHYQIWIAFFRPPLLTGFCIQIDYPKDSLNYTLQALFSKPTLECSSNFINRGVEYTVGTYCEPNGRINFSTFFSERPFQELQIDSFSYEEIDGILYYHLDYSASDLELTNSGWNSRSKTDQLGHKLKSKLLIENIPVRNLIGQIEFEFPATE